MEWIVQGNMSHNRLWVALKHVKGYGFQIAYHKRFNAMLRQIRKQEEYNGKHNKYTETT